MDSSAVKEGRRGSDLSSVGQAKEDSPPDIKAA